MGQDAGKDILFRYSAGDHKKGDQGAQHPAGDHHEFQESDDGVVNKGGKGRLPAADRNSGRQGII